MCTDKAGTLIPVPSPVPERFIICGLIAFNVLFSQNYLGDSTVCVPWLGFLYI